MRSSPRLPPVIALPAATFIVSAWIAAALFYRDLPGTFPTHWSALLQPDGYTRKPGGVFLVPLAMTVVWLGRGLLYHLAPRRQRVERFPGAFDFRVMLTIGLLFVIWTVAVAQSVPWPQVLAIPASVAAALGSVPLIRRRLVK